MPRVESGLCHHKPNQVQQQSHNTPKYYNTSRCKSDSVRGMIERIMMLDNRVKTNNAFWSPYGKNIAGDYSTLCWLCDREKDMCSWEKDLKPVDGWTAEKSVNVKGAYHVLDCPLFQRARPTQTISAAEVLSMKGVN